MICREVGNDCKNPDSYGTICVLCNECHRFDITYKCVNCDRELEGTTLEYPKEWGKVEFYDSLRTPVCPDCKKYFPDELEQEDGYSHKVISCKMSEFHKREC